MRSTPATTRRQPAESTATRGTSISHGECPRKQEKDGTRLLSRTQHGFAMTRCVFGTMPVATALCACITLPANSPFWLAYPNRCLTNFGSIWPGFGQTQQVLTNSCQKQSNWAGVAHAHTGMGDVLAHHAWFTSTTNHFTILSHVRVARKRIGARENGCACGTGCLAGL